MFRTVVEQLTTNIAFLHRLLEPKFNVTRVSMDTERRVGAYSLCDSRTFTVYYVSINLQCTIQALPFERMSCMSCQLSTTSLPQYKLFTVFTKDHGRPNCFVASYILSSEWSYDVTVTSAMTVVALLLLLAT